MARYLLVLVDVAEAPALVESATSISAAEPNPEFVLLVPATPLSPIDCLVTPQATPAQAARRKAHIARSQLQAAGVVLEATRLGNADPLVAVEDALRFSHYAAVLIACTPHGFIHGLHRDLAARLTRRFPTTQITQVSHRRHGPLVGQT